MRTKKDVEEAVRDGWMVYSNEDGTWAHDAVIRASAAAGARAPGPRDGEAQAAQGPRAQEEGELRMSDAKPRTVRVRIAVAVTSDSKWYARGCYDEDDHRMLNYARGSIDSAAAVVFVEADVPVPEPVTVQGEVKP